jgi:hypothetical protein
MRTPFRSIALAACSAVASWPCLWATCNSRLCSSTHAIFRSVTSAAYGRSHGTTTRVHASRRLLRRKTLGPARQQRYAPLRYLSDRPSLQRTRYPLSLWLLQRFAPARLCGFSLRRFVCTVVSGSTSTTACMSGSWRGVCSCVHTPRVDSTVCACHSLSAWCARPERRPRKSAHGEARSRGDRVCTGNGRCRVCACAHTRPSSAGDPAVFAR